METSAFVTFLDSFIPFLFSFIQAFSEHLKLLSGSAVDFSDSACVNLKMKSQWTDNANQNHHLQFIFYCIKILKMLIN